MRACERGLVGVVKAMGAGRGERRHVRRFEPAEREALERVVGSQPRRAHDAVLAAILDVRARADRRVRAGLPEVRVPEAEVVAPLVQIDAGVVALDPRAFSTHVAEPAVAAEGIGAENDRVEIEVRRVVRMRASAIGVSRGHGACGAHQRVVRAVVSVPLLGLRQRQHGSVGEGGLGFSVGPVRPLIHDRLQLRLDRGIRSRLEIRRLIGKAHANREERFVALGIGRRNHRARAARIAGAAGLRDELSVRRLQILADVPVAAQPHDLHARVHRRLVALALARVAGDRAHRVRHALHRADVRRLGFFQNLVTLLAHREQALSIRELHGHAEDRRPRARDVREPPAIRVSAVVFFPESRRPVDRLLHRLPRQRPHRQHHQIPSPAHAMLDHLRDLRRQRLAERVRQQRPDRRPRVTPDQRAHRIAPRPGQRAPFGQKRRPFPRRCRRIPLRPRAESIHRPGDLRRRHRHRARRGIRHPHHTRRLRSRTAVRSRHRRAFHHRHRWRDPSLMHDPRCRNRLRRLRSEPQKSSRPGEEKGGGKINAAAWRASHQGGARISLNSSL